MRRLESQAGGTQAGSVGLVISAGPGSRQRHSTSQGSRSRRPGIPAQSQKIARSRGEAPHDALTGSAGRKAMRPRRRRGLPVGWQEFRVTAHVAR